MLEIVKAIKCTGELSLQIIENHQRLLEMTPRVEKLVNGESIVEKAQIKMGPIDNEEDLRDNSPSPMSATSVD